MHRLGSATAPSQDKQATNNLFFQHDDDPINGDKSESNNRKNKSKIIKFIEIYKFCKILIKKTLTFLICRKFLTNSCKFYGQSPPPPPPPPPQGTTPPPGAGPCPITCPGVALSRPLITLTLMCVYLFQQNQNTSSLTLIAKWLVFFHFGQCEG